MNCARLIGLFSLCTTFVGLGRGETIIEPLWDTAPLIDTPPPAKYGQTTSLTQEVWYEGAPLAEKPTQVFAYLGKPPDASRENRAPAMLLVHGGGGKAFREWAEHWARRGYVALAMDTAGQGPDGKRHENAGPDQSDDTRFRNFGDSEARDMWTYHAVAAVLRGHGLLNSLPEVDTERIGITGISWGGYLTCIIAGLDHRLKVAVPVYGCGFLGVNSVWRDTALASMQPESRERWLRLFDPSVYIGKTACPILFITGMHDFAYPPDSYRQTFNLVSPTLRTLSVRVDLEHGHYWTFPEVDAFVDSVLQPGRDHPQLVRLSDVTVDETTVSARVIAGGPAIKAELHYTNMAGDWSRRVWTTKPAPVTTGTLTATLPPERPLTFFLTATDARGLLTSTPYEEIVSKATTSSVPKAKGKQDASASAGIPAGT